MIILIKAVLFDLGGVVVRWSDDIVWRKIASEYHLNFRRAKRKLDYSLAFPETGRMSVKRMIENFLKSAGDMPTKNYEKMWVKEYEKGVRIDGKVLGIAKRLKKKYKVGVISNVENSHLRVIRKRGWLKHFDFAVLSCEVRTRKPARKIYRIALRKLHLRPKETVFIDNLEENIVGARRVGMNAILFKNVKQLERDLKKHL